MRSNLQKLYHFKMEDISTLIYAKTFALQKQVGDILDPIFHPSFIEYAWHYIDDYIYFQTNNIPQSWK